MFDIIAIPFGWIMRLCYDIVSNYGWALIIFTIVTKLMLLPLSVKQQKSSAKMAYYKPRIDEIQAKYKKNPEKMQAEMQKFYEEEGYNPYSGCLPLLITFPVLFGVIGVVYKPLTHILQFSQETVNKLLEIVRTVGIELAEKVSYPELEILKAVSGEHKDAFIAGVASFDSSAAAALSEFNNTFLGINFSEIPSWTSLLIIIPILAAVTGVLTSLVSMKTMKNKDGSDAGAMQGSSKVMMLLMPVISFFFALGMPSGIGFYWIISNIVAMLQTVVLAKFYNPAKLADKIEAERIAKKEKMKAQKAKIAEARRRLNLPDAAESAPKAPLTEEEKVQALKQKEIDRQRLAEARRRDAEKYGEVYEEVDDKDLL